MKHGDSARRALEQLASIVGRCVVAQLGDRCARGGAAEGLGAGRPPRGRLGARRAGDARPSRRSPASRSARSLSRGGGGGAIGADVHSNAWLVRPTDAGASGWAAIVARPASELPMMAASLASKPAGPARRRRSADLGGRRHRRGGARARLEARAGAVRARLRVGRPAARPAGEARRHARRPEQGVADRRRPERADHRGEHLELHAQKAAKSGAAALSDDEIDRLVKEREQARFTSDYKTADRLRDTLEKHGVHLDTKENKWQAADGRSGPIGPVNISAAHAQKAARAGAPKMPVEEIESILVQREQARARRDYKTADVLRDTLEKHGVYLDAKENEVALGRRSGRRRRRRARRGSATTSVGATTSAPAAGRRRGCATTTRRPTGCATSSTSSASRSTTRRTAGTRRTAARATSSRSPEMRCPSRRHADAAVNE